MSKNANTATSEHRLTCLIKRTQNYVHGLCACSQFIHFATETITLNC